VVIMVLLQMDIILFSYPRLRYVRMESGV